MTLNRGVLMEVEAGLSAVEKMALRLLIGTAHGVASLRVLIERGRHLHRRATILPKTRLSNPPSRRGILLEIEPSRSWNNSSRSFRRFPSTVIFWRVVTATCRRSVLNVDLVRSLGNRIGAWNCCDNWCPTFLRCPTIASIYARLWA